MTEFPVKTAFVKANGLTFEVDQCGTGDKFALLLHGFPESKFSWRYQMPLLARLGYTVWAPNLRGYGRSSRPGAVGDYHIDHLVADAAALIDAAGAKNTLLMAHDWGAIIAWQFAIRRTRPLDRLVIMNVPHPACLARELRTWAQLKKSWYVFFFQIPWLPERLLAAKKAEAVGRAFVDMAIDKAKFPVAVNDAYAALCWVAANASRLGIDAQRIVVAGDSAGGNLTVVTCLMARERGGPSIRFQVPIYPSLDMRARPNYGSRARWGGGGYILDNDDIEWMLDHYLSLREEASDWRASPILAKTYAGLPPALVVTADHDPLADEGKLYAERLTADGVDVEHACFEGTFHGFVGYASLIDVGARGVNLICERIKHAVWK